MVDPATATGSRRPVDQRALAQVLARLRRAPAAPWLHGEVARRMAEKLQAIRVQPSVVVDWWPSLGASTEALRKAYPKARHVGVEPEAKAVESPWWSPGRWSGRRAGAVAESALAPGGAQLVWANMVLHFVADPQAQLQAWRDALAVDGFLMFSTLGPGTLASLAALYRAQGWPPPAAAFVDMHDLGDMLVHAGFADPVMDQETITLNWRDPDALLAELRALGGNAHPSRHAGLRTPRWRRQLVEALSRAAGAEGRPALDFEVVYGHAFRPQPRLRVAPETQVPIDALRASLRSRGTPRS
ncbi:MAG: class I SAM-dependent methyltransferase [Rubrivivax sp.]